MSHTHSLSPPPEPLTAIPSSAPPPPDTKAASAAVHEMAQRLRAELAATADRSRQARLLMDVAGLEERMGDEPSAARDYLASYNADQSFREPLEGLVRLLVKRRSLKNLGKLVDALVRVAFTPDEKVRALLMRAAVQADVAGDLGEAKKSAQEATTIDDCSVAEQASAWLALEVLAGRAGDPAVREWAFAQRTRFAFRPSWRALLLVDRARMAAASAQPDAAVALLQEARTLESPATWTAITLIEEILADSPDGTGDAWRSRAETLAETLDEIAALTEGAAADGARGDALGVPQWARQPARLVDTWLRAAELRRQLGQMDRAAATLDRALAYLRGLETDDARLADAAVVGARIRVAEQSGDAALAAALAERRLATETDRGLAAALAMRVAEYAASQGEADRAFQALSRALGCDPACLPARALQLDMLADGSDSIAFAGQLEAFADHLETDDARGRAFLLAAYVWAVHARDPAGAKAALSQAAMYGVAPSTTSRIARALASTCEDLGWYEEATKRLLAAGCDEGEVVSLYVELVRLRNARGDREGGARALREMGATPAGAWLARVLEAFLPPAAVERSGGDRADPADHSSDRARAAIEELAVLEKDPELARGLALVAALRGHAAGDVSTARQKLRGLADSDPSDLLVASMLADFDRGAGDHAAAAHTASASAAATHDPELATALHLEAGFERWRAGDRRGSLQEFERAVPSAPDAAKMVIGWAGRGVDVESVDGRKDAIARALDGGSAEAGALALERFCLEVGGGDGVTAAASLQEVDRSPHEDIAIGGALARLAWFTGTSDASAHDEAEAIARIAARGPRASALASAEQARLSRDKGDRAGLAIAARRWFEAGGALPAALEWLGAAMALGDLREEARARLGIAATLSGDAREAMLATATIAQSLADPDNPAPFAPGGSQAVRLVNLEVSPPGCDPRRRAAALAELDGSLGEEAAGDAIALAGWGAFAAANIEDARACFDGATRNRPDDLGSWEGLRACGELTGDRALRATAAAELGARCNDSTRGAAFWEEAALLWFELGEEERAERALEESFARDAHRAVAFDRLFRRVRARKDNDKLLALVARRMDVAEDPDEIQKLFWEQARVLREKGDQEGALRSLEHVTMLDPDHIGALALLGEINIRRGRFEEAAASLARLAMLDTAPPKNRVTAGVAAVDLYENKLDRFDKALEVLLSLHQARLSTLPVRERLARAAARTGAWNEATKMLEELMNERTDAQGRIEAARLAMTIHRDRLERPQGAGSAIARLLQESPADGEAIDLLLKMDLAGPGRKDLLDAARREIVHSLQKHPTDITAIRRLASIAHALSDEAQHRAALGVLVSLGAADARSEQALVQAAAQKSRPPQIAIDQEMLRALLAPGDAGPVADLFLVLGPTLVEALGPTIQGCGVGRRDKVDPRSGIGLRNEIAAWAGAFGLHEFDLYVGGSDPVGVRGVPGDPPSLVVGAGINSPIAPAARARVARELFAMARGTTVVRLRDEITICAIVVAACRLAHVALDHPPYAVLAEVERQLGKVIARRTRRLLPDLCGAIVGRGADPRLWSRRALASHDRVEAIASGDPSVVLLGTFGASEGAAVQTVKGNARAEELLRFVLSPQYLQVRRGLGLDGGEMP
jgi:cellulose synthase operon protein C